MYVWKRGRFSSTDKHTKIKVLPQKIKTDVLVQSVYYCMTSGEILYKQCGSISLGVVSKNLENVFHFQASVMTNNVSNILIVILKLNQ